MNNEILQHFQYIVLVIKDHLATLPESSKIAVSNAVSHSLQEVETHIRNTMDGLQKEAQSDLAD